MSELGPLVASAPVVTFVGAGGVGKTRLAEEVCDRWAAQFGDGAAFVELAEVRNATQIVDTVAAALGVRDHESRGLAAYLRGKHLLLVLDNCEHLVGECGAFVADLVRQCPDLHVLATSREPLNIQGEIIWLVRPLSLPDPDVLATLGELEEVSSVRLFVERANAIDRRFAVTESNAAVLVRICIALDGMPLALELAAALTRVLSLEQIAQKLASDVDILSAPRRVGPPRHRTIRATIDWSHDLLDTPEQKLLRRLAVFAGWTLEMAEEVCAGDGLERGDVLGVLARLVDKSMVVADPTPREARYRLLAPIRQYALERLSAAGESQMYGQRHAALMLASDCRTCASTEREPNFRIALRWLLDNDETDPRGD